MKKISIFSAILVFFGFNLSADILDIPEVKVYGERKIEFKTIKKELLPFEKEYLEPKIKNTKKELPHFKVLDKKIIERNIGCRAEATGGTYLGGYFLGYSRRIFYPLEVGLNFTQNSTAESSSRQIFSRTSNETFYANGAFVSGGELHKPVYRFNIGNTLDIFDFDLFGVYSDSLIGVADINFRYSSLRLNLQLETSLDYNVKIAFEEYPVQAGIVLFENNRIYPELVLFLPVYDLYIKGNLFDKTGIAYLYCQSLPYLPEYSSSDTYYRIEFGQSTNILPLSLIYSRYLNNSLNYVGIKGTYREIFWEFEYPLESDYDYILRAGLSTEFYESIYTNIFGYINGSENYFIGADLGYNLMNNLKVGIEADYIYNLSSENGFDISGYVFVAF
jgi:hypothetical protein